jgi:serine/threonine protein kinase
MVGSLQETWLNVGYDHQNISPTWPATVTLAGVTVPAIATPYYSSGHVLEYMHFHRGADRLNIACQIASALTHIHLNGVVHGNVCPVSFALILWRQCLCLTSIPSLIDVGF